ncbi:MAG: Hint domain-containing protein [Rhodobacter sp.]|nr:Hint domain-containing protein [Rhodobacter sp.]
MAYACPSRPAPPPAHRGPLIEVPGGRIPMQELQTGDLVRTKDHGFQPVRWIGRRRLQRADFAADPALRPIRIRAGALGPATPAHDLVVSPQHGVLLDDWRCALLFGEDEMLVPAAALLNDHNVTVDRAAEEIAYCDLIFDRHEIVYVNGAETESCHPGAAHSGDADDTGRDELLKLFPERDVERDGCGWSARATLKRHEVAVLRAI